MGPGLTQDLELNRDIEEIYKTTVQNRANWKKSHIRPVFAEENYPIAKGASTYLNDGNNYQSEIQLKNVLKSN